MSGICFGDLCGCREKACHHLQTYETATWNAGHSPILIQLNMSFYGVLELTLKPPKASGVYGQAHRKQPQDWPEQYREAVEDEEARARSEATAMFFFGPM